MKRRPRTAQHTGGRERQRYSRTGNPPPVRCHAKPRNQATGALRPPIRKGRDSNPNTVEISRHAGTDCRHPDHKDVTPQFVPSLWVPAVPAGTTGIWVNSTALPARRGFLIQQHRPPGWTLRFRIGLGTASRRFLGRGEGNRPWRECFPGSGWHECHDRSNPGQAPATSSFSFREAVGMRGQQQSGPCF